MNWDIAQLLGIMDQQARVPVQAPPQIIHYNPVNIYLTTPQVREAVDKFVEAAEPEEQKSEQLSQETVDLIEKLKMLA